MVRYLTTRLLRKISTKTIIANIGETNGDFDNRTLEVGRQWHLKFVWFPMEVNGEKIFWTHIWFKYTMVVTSTGKYSGAQFSSFMKPQIFTSDADRIVEALRCKDIVVVGI